MISHAETWWNLGYAPLPIRPNGTKAPACKWRDFLEQRPTRDELDGLFSCDHDGYGIVTGAVSGNLELLELEGRAAKEGLFNELTQAFADNGLAEIWARVTGGYVEATPSGGIHIYYRVDGPARPNTKLARRPATADELDAWKQDELGKAGEILDDQLRAQRVQRIEQTQPSDILEVLIETRGEGGFTVVAPSDGRSHSTGLAWAAIQGTPADIPTISVDDRDALYAICGLLDQTPARKAAPTVVGVAQAVSGQPGSGLRPGDDYNAKTTWDDLLIPDGWTKMHTIGDTVEWCRPGKHPRDGMSATTGRREGAQDCLYVFSSSVDLPIETPISKFAYYALTKHAGNYQAAAAQLSKDGYGDPMPLDRPLTLIRTEESPCSTTGAAAASGITQPSTNQKPTAGTNAPPIDGNTALAINPAPVAAIVTSLTDKGNADLIVAGHHQHLHYVPSRKAWITWTGHKWQIADDNAPAIQAAQQAILGINVDGDKELAKHQKSSLSRRALEAAVSLASTHPAMRIPAEQLDADPHVLNTPSGIVDLRDGSIRDAGPDDWCTHMTEASYDLEADAPRWKAFLEETFDGDVEMISYVQRLAGYSAYGAVSHHILPFAFGPGGAGKTVFLETIMGVLGDYATIAPASFLMAGRNDESAIAALSGQRLVVCSEVNERDRFDEAKVKLLTGGDRIKSRFLYGNYFTFTPTHHLWLMANHQPRIEAGGDGMWRRLRILPFTRQVPAESRIPGLADQLKSEEASGILNWIVRGAVDAINHDDLRDPANVASATATYAAEEDALARFIEDRCMLTPAGRTGMPEVRAAYAAWCHEEGEQEMTSQSFGRALRMRWGIKGGKSHGRRVYDGLILLSEEEEPDRKTLHWSDR